MSYDDSETTYHLTPKGWTTGDAPQAATGPGRMNVLVYLVPIALGLGLTGLLAFLWALKSGQYEDMDGAALRVLDDDDIE